MIDKYKHLERVIHVAAKHYNGGGITALAAVMGKSQAILSNKLNPDCETNALTFVEALAIIELTNEHAVIDGIAQLLGRTTIVLPESSKTPKDILANHVALSKVNGDLGQKILDAKHPESEWGESFSPREKKHIKERALVLAQSCMDLINGLDD